MSDHESKTPVPDEDDRQPAVDAGSPEPGDDGGEGEAGGYDPLAALTVAELRAASKAAGFDVVTAITQRTADRTEALARVLWLHRRRADLSRKPADVWAEIEPMTYLELNAALGEVIEAHEGPGPTTRAG